jgi:hypothetical protein
MNPKVFEEGGPPWVVKGLPNTPMMPSSELTDQQVADCVGQTLTVMATALPEPIGGVGYEGKV